VWLHFRGRLEDDEAAHAPAAERHRPGQALRRGDDLCPVVGHRGSRDIESILQVDGAAP
jgi:hypothetical protein